MLFIAGKNIPQRKALYEHDLGRLIRVAKGVYIEKKDGDHVVNVIQAHALRLANYFLPDAALSYSSALTHNGLCGDSHLHVFGTYPHRIVLPGLVILQNKQSFMSRNGGKGLLVEKGVADGMTRSAGSLRVKRVCDEVLLLQAFDECNEQGRSLSRKDIFDVVERLSQKYETDESRFREAMFHFADKADLELNMMAFIDRLQKDPSMMNAFRDDSTPKPQALKYARDMTIRWHKEKIGSVVFDGNDWKFKITDEGWILPIENQVGRQAHGLPAFIGNMLPEGWLRIATGSNRGDSGALNGRRYMSNISIHEKGGAPAEDDFLLARLDDHSHDGQFTGSFLGMAFLSENGASVGWRAAEEHLASLWKNGDMPRLSGVQMKVPLTLSKQGDLGPASNTPFTHILKMPGTRNDEVLPSIEWYCLEVMSRAGFDVAKHAVLSLPGFPPALLIERFDIRPAEKSKERFFCETLCSAMGFHSSSKYDSSMEEVARVSLKPRAESLSEVKPEHLLEMAVSTWVRGDDDFHLKNISLLFTEDEYGRRSVALSPYYDTVCTEALPAHRSGKVALEVNGKMGPLSLDDFLAFAKNTLKMTDEGARSVIHRVASSMAVAAAAVSANLPDAIKENESCMEAIEDCENLIISRAMDIEDALNPDFESQVIPEQAETDNIHTRGI